MTLPNEPRQSTNTVLMVAPTQFCLNKDAAEDNHFMTATGLTPETITKKALDEFDGLVSVLRSHGVDVNVFTHEAADEADFTTKTKMAFPGFKSAQDRPYGISFLKQVTSE
eukprot:TRINITY_DN6546_c0_g1_i2.p1 TRINITY_DN6546_c0_g1~~TRINITY_DN6546_c0_g1_i2.p1  ORF type:complete len:128 (-),score=39.04 TRINITY_DN6546_c0_g1_i2:35-367(-)